MFKLKNYYGWLGGFLIGYAVSDFITSKFSIVTLVVGLSGIFLAYSRILQLVKEQNKEDKKDKKK
jgi:energy-converting hydrogenase Eha subunit E